MVFMPSGEILRNSWRSEMKRIKKPRTQKPRYKTKLWGWGEAHGHLELYYTCLRGYTKGTVNSPCPTGT